MDDPRDRRAQQGHDDTTPRGHAGLLRKPLFRLLAINLAVGAAMAVFLVGGLLAINPGGLRDLIFGDRDPAVPLVVLLLSFFVTFGSAAMGTAIMALGQREDLDGPPRGPRRLALQRLLRSVRP
ncbi:hypothetical protein [Bradyrhizobium sp.]|uniref:hypothetical protein n=1 Tax=Bradyrhizobium sp. TaxID=376 RepID=UPI003C6F16CF